jgi:hypothetical protein
MKKETESKNKIHRGGELSSGHAKPKSFILYVVQKKCVDYLTTEQKGLLLDALYRTVAGEDSEDIENELPMAVKIAYGFINSQVERDQVKYQKTCESRSKAAKARWAKREENANASFAMLNNTDTESYTDTETDTESYTDTDTETESYTEKEERNSSSSSSNNDSDGVAEEDEDEEEKILKFSKKGALGWMSWFKELVETNESRISPPKIMTLERARGLYQLIKKFGRETVANVFRRAVQTSFLNGKGKNKFVASFDWLLMEKNFVNVYEGKFYC